MKIRNLIFGLAIFATCSTFAQIPTNGLVAYYPFNGDANDASGNGYNGSVYNITYSNGVIGQSAQFNQSKIQMNIPNSVEFTISGWINVNDTMWAGITGKQQIWLSRVSDNSMDRIEFANAGNPLTKVGVDALDATWSVGEGISDMQGDIWHFFVVTHSGDNFSWYIDGKNVPDGSITSTAEIEVGAIMTLGGQFNADVNNPSIHDQYYYGKIDEFRYYNRVLSQDEMKKIYTEDGNYLVTDIDGNTYNTVQIGTQTWMAENLKTTKYRNGDPIGTTVPATLDISGESSPKYQWAYEGNEINVPTYGRLYTWNAITDSRNICPTGWHVPSSLEYDSLINQLGGIDISGSKLKEAGTAHWNSPNSDATNESGFSALPSGYRNFIGAFNYIGLYETWWASTEENENLGNVYNLNYALSSLLKTNDWKSNGRSIRCIKDSDKSITVNDALISEAQPVEVPISVSELVAGDNIISYQFDINYDNAVLSYTGNSVVGTIATGGTVLVNSTIAGKLSVSYMNSSAIVGTGNILKLQFNTLMADTTDVTISKVLLNSTPIIKLTNGMVIIKDVTSPTAAVTYNDTDIRLADNLLITATLSEPMVEATPLKLSLSGAAILTNVDMTRISSTVYTYTYLVPKGNGAVTVGLSNGTDLWGNEIVTSPTSGSTFSIVPVVYGDVDEDTKILAYDAALTLQLSVGLDPLPSIDLIPWENWRDSSANVDGIGAVTANDASLILQHSVGLISSFPADASKKAYTTSAVADVTVTVENGNIVFQSTGDLYGLNVFVNSNREQLGQPVFLDANLLKATNISASSYAIGICSSSPVAEGVNFMTIPFTATSSWTATIDMIVNTEAKQVVVDLATGIVRILDIGSVYPNPAKDVLNLRNINPNASIAIYDVNGKMVLDKRTVSDQIDISHLAKGLYMLKVIENGKSASHTFVKE